MTEETQNLPVSWEDELAKQAKDVARMERPSIGRINFRGGIMTYEGEEVTGNALDVIILNYSYENSFYAGDFDPDKIVPPDCFALEMPEDAGDGGRDMKPHPNVEEPVHENCHDCPNFQWGSGKGRGKACGTRRRLAMIPATEDVLSSPTALRAVEVAMATLSVTSVRNWGTYVNTVSAQAARPPWAVVTRMAVVPDRKYQFKITFDHKENIDLNEEIFAVLRDRVKEVENILLTPFDPNTGVPEEVEAPKGKKFTKN